MSIKCIVTYFIEYKMIDLQPIDYKIFPIKDLLKLGFGHLKTNFQKNKMPIILNNEQKNIIKLINSGHKGILITGMAGTGKSTTLS